MVNEPGGHYSAVGVDSAIGRFSELADSHDFPILHRHICVKGRPAGAVNHAPVLDKQVIRHFTSSVLLESLQFAIF